MPTRPHLKGRSRVERAGSAKADALLVQHAKRHLDALLVGDEQRVIHWGAVEVVCHTALANT